MAVLDLQDMKVQGAHGKGPPPGSRTSKGCNNGNNTTVTSNVSLIICILAL